MRLQGAPTSCAEGGSPKDLSGHGKNTTKWGLTSRNRSGEDSSGHAKKATLWGCPRAGAQRGRVGKGKGDGATAYGTHLWGAQKEDASGHRNKASDTHELAVQVVVEPGVVAQMKSGLLGSINTVPVIPATGVRV